MRRTIATMLLIAGWASASVATADDSAAETSSEPSRIAQYHLGDGDEATASAAAKSASTQNATYDGSEATEQVALASAGVEVEAGNGPTYGAPSCGSGCCSDWFCNSVRLEYLMWFSRGRNTPPLVTTSPDGTPQGEAGVLGFDSTQVLYGNDPIGGDLRSGLRVTLNHLLADECTWADVRFWGVQDSTEEYSAFSIGSPILAIPYQDAVLSNVESSQLLAYPGVSTDGSVSVQSSNDLMGVDLWLRRCWQQGCCSHIDILGGYMFTRMDDSLAINSQYTSLTFPSFGTVNSFHDSFRTQNEFHGVQLGFLAEGHRDRVGVELLGKVAIGNMSQRVIIDGSRSATTINGSTSTFEGGLFTQPSNIGNYQRDRFCFVPEINANLVYKINCCWKATLGYTFIYWNDVVLAGDQIDRRLNRAQANNPNPQLPEASFTRSDFWVQGLSFGMQYQW